MDISDSPRRRGRHQLHPPTPQQQPRPLGCDDMSAFRSRSSRIGRVLRPDDAFVLRPGLPMPGAVSVAAAFALVIADWKQQVLAGQIAEGTVSTHSKHLATLAKFAAARGASLVCDVSNELLNEWMFAANAYTGEPSAESTFRIRRAVAASAYYTMFRLGITDSSPAANLPNGTRSARYVSAFSDTDIDRLKEAAQFRFRETKSPAALALALLGAAPGEVGSITCADIHLTDMLVRAHGGGTRYAQRWLPIDDPWAFDQLAARLAVFAREHPDDWEQRYVAYTPRPGNDDDFARRSAATSTTLSKVIERAGLKNNGVRRVASIGEYVAVRIFAETGRIEAVAARLGINKLDDVAHIVGYDWKTEFAITGPVNLSGGES